MVPDLMHHHIEAGNVVGVKEAIAEGTAINQYSAAGLTPLGKAILCGNLAIARLLLNKGADISLAYRSDLCLDKNCVQSQWPDICPAIHSASASGSAELIHLLVDHGADVDDPNGTDYGAQVFPLYISKGDATKALIELGADVSRKNASGFTPLLHAMAREDIASTKLLVENGADVEVERITKYRLRVASESNKGETEERLIEGTSSPLIVACHQGRLRPTSADMITILASAGADVNRRYYIKYTESNIIFTAMSLICGSRTPAPILRGAYAKKDHYGDKEVAAIKALISGGADINDPPIINYICQGEIPLIDFESRLEVMQMLVKHGLQLNPQSNRTLQGDLLKFLTKYPEAEVQFKSVAAILAKAGMKWDLSESEMEQLRH